MVTTAKMSLNRSDAGADAKTSRYASSKSPPSNTTFGSWSKRNFEHAVTKGTTDNKNEFEIADLKSHLPAAEMPDKSDKISRGRTQLKIYGIRTNFPPQSLPDIHVKKSSIKNSGRGLFASQIIRKGDYIGEYVGERIPLPPLPEDTGECTSIGANEFTMVLYDLGNGYCLDRSKNPSIVYYVNCQNKLSDCNVTFTKKGLGELSRVIVEAIRDIRKGEELFARYGDESFNFHETRPIPKVESCLKLRRNGSIIERGSYIYVQGPGSVWLARMEQFTVSPKQKITIQVVWLYSRKELESMKKGTISHKLRSGCKAKLFLTDHTDWIDIDTVIGLVTAPLVKMLLPSRGAEHIVLKKRRFSRR